MGHGRRRNGETWIRRCFIPHRNGLATDGVMLTTLTVWTSGAAVATIGDAGIGKGRSGGGRGRMGRGRRCR